MSIAEEIQERKTLLIDGLRKAVDELEAEPSYHAYNNVTEMAWMYREAHLRYLRSLPEPPKELIRSLEQENA